MGILVRPTQPNKEHEMDPAGSATPAERGHHGCLCPGLRRFVGLANPVEVLFVGFRRGPISTAASIAAFQDNG